MCIKTPSKLCGKKTCKDCRKKSFADCDKSIYWSNKNELNPWEVTKNSGKKILFNCDKCDHTFDKVISDLTRYDTWCPYCSVKPTILCKRKNCNTCFNRSFASHKKSKYWSKKNIEIPRNIFKNNNKKFIFDCKCGHEICVNLSSISAGSWCSYCSSSPKKLCDKKNCNSCYENSFASIKYSKNFSKKIK